MLLLLLLSLDSRTEHTAVLGGVSSIYFVPAHYINKGASYLMPRQRQVLCEWGGGGGGPQNVSICSMDVERPFVWNHQLQIRLSLHTHIWQEFCECTFLVSDTCLWDYLSNEQAPMVQRQTTCGMNMHQWYKGGLLVEWTCTNGPMVQRWTTCGMNMHQWYKLFWLGKQFRGSTLHRL